MRAINLTLFAALCLGCGAQLPKFKVIREWKYINFTWADEQTYEQAETNGLYIPKNIVVSGLKHFENHYYITLPRMRDGVPATLARIPSGFTRSTAPLLEPYPSWSMNMQGDCNALQNVQNIEIDPRGYLWIIDGGRVETLNPKPIIKCPPKLIIYNIMNNIAMTTYTFPDEVASFNGSYLYDLVLDFSDGGYAYITDNSGKDPGLIVYSLKENNSWKIRHGPSMRADPNAAQFRVNEVTISAPINIAGIALGPKVQASDDKVKISEDREVYYAPLSSLRLFSLNTTVLKDVKSSNNGNEYQGAVMDLGEKPSQSVGMIMDNKANLYYGLLGTNAVAKWDTKMTFQGNQRPIARDPEYLQWVTSFTFDNGNLTVLVNKLNKFIYNGYNVNEANFRLITAFIDSKSYLEDNFAYDTNEYSTKEPQASTSDQMYHNHMDHMAHINGNMDTPSTASKFFLSSVVVLVSLVLML
ncbi:unnamed protein product [Brassicogethes aeneus]|uniref:Uncharacterized protein n=1 Tax=Brassicogethes aeneus TaxID=1431903 RepID=A0A9P0FQ19_BRAAE|nr:unnamed protein product [Brassicogethes aeneus]